MIEIQIIIVDGQWIMKSHPDLTADEWRRVGERLATMPINFIPTGDDEGPNIPA